MATPRQASGRQVSAADEQAPDKAVRLAELRSCLRRLGAGGNATWPPLSLGLAPLDAALGGGLSLGCLHDVIGAPGDGAAAGFCAALAGRLAAAGRPALWCQPRLDLYGPGLAAFGLDPTRLIAVAAHRAADRLWAMEEGLRCPALAAVVGELAALDDIAARRLQLAAETGGVTGFVLRPGGAPALTGIPVTRWRVTAMSSAGTSFAGGAQRDAPPGAACWQVELLRCRGGRPGIWVVEWCDATGGFTLAAALRDEPLARAAGA